MTNNPIPTPKELLVPPMKLRQESRLGAWCPAPAPMRQRLREQLVLGSSSAASSAAATPATSSAAGTSSAAASSGSSASLTKVVVPGVPTLAQLYAGSTTSPPTTSPAGAKGKSVWWISCSQAAPSCAQPAAQAAAAAKTMGIDFHVADGKFDVGEPSTPR